MEFFKVCFHLSFFFDRTKYIDYTDIINCDFTYPKGKLNYFVFTYFGKP